VTGAPVLASHIRMVPSSLPVTIRFPSGLNAKPMTDLPVGMILTVSRRATTPVNKAPVSASAEIRGAARICCNARTSPPPSLPASMDCACDVRISAIAWFRWRIADRHWTVANAAAVIAMTVRMISAPMAPRRRRRKRRCSRTSLLASSYLDFPWMGAARSVTLSRNVGVSHPTAHRRSHQHRAAR